MSTPAVSRRVAAVALALCALEASTSSLNAQLAPDSAGKTEVPKSARVFRDARPFAMTLTADFKSVFKDRDTTSTKLFPATLKYVGEAGDTVSLDVQLATRGHFRLKPSTCAFPPIKVHFDKEKTKGGPFGGEGSLKLGTHCQRGDRYAQNTLIEYAINQMYSLVSPISLKTRLASVTWIDPADPKFTITRPGFWLEDEDEVAKQVRGKVVMQQGGTPTDMNPRLMAITDVFQYMIANTDFSLWALHNFRIFATDTSMMYLPMAYDFDWSGLVDAPYARPDYRLPIKRVTDRLYRGACHPPEVLTDVLGLYRTKKDALYGTLRELPGLDPKRLKEATDFLDEFYKMIDDPGQVKREFGRVCS
ncbi:MAG: hypothetical protein ACRENB_05515 [Gemmatimonadales bacterium]